MVQNMNMELLTFSLILYQSKKCGHRIHVLFMMYGVYWYRQMKKNEWLWKFWKRNDLYENFEKRGGSREKGGGNEIHAPCACGYIWGNMINIINKWNRTKIFIQQICLNLVIIYQFIWIIIIYEHCVNLWCKYRISPKTLASNLFMFTEVMHNKCKQDTILKIGDFSTKN